MSAYAEKDSWALPHRLNVDVTRRENDLLPLIDKFGPRLRLCYQERNLMTIDYQYWFVNPIPTVFLFRGSHRGGGNPPPL